MSAGERCPSFEDAEATLDATHSVRGERARTLPLTLGSYVLLERVGSGAMGSVYRAADQRLRRSVAIKILVHTGERTRTEVVREARALARLSVPNVVQVFEAGVYDGQPYVVMEFVDGDPLDTWLASHPRSPTDILAVFRQAGEGLAAAHEQGLVHRDFKPANVLVGRDGRVRVVDFGLALPHPSHASTVDEVVGTPAYLAPECFALHAATSQSDQFSFCVALYEALYRRHPFGEQGDSATELALRILQGTTIPPPRIRGVSDRMRAAVLRGLAREPSDRWSGMAELLAALRPSTRSARPIVVGVLAVGLIAALAWPESSARACTDTDGRLAAFWLAEEQHVHTALVAALDAHGEDTWSAVRPRFDNYADEWAAAHAEACRLADSDPRELDAMMTCLDERRAAFEELVRVADEAAGGILSAVVGLVPPASCLEQGAERSNVEPPGDPEVSRQVIAVRRQLERAKVLLDVGQIEEATALARAGLEHAEEIGYEPLRVEALYVVGMAVAEAGDAEDGARQLQAVFYAAEAVEHRQVAAESAVKLAWVYAERLHRNADAELWDRHAESELALIDDPALSLTALTRRIASRRYAADASAMEKEVAQALALLDAMPDRDPLWMGGRLNNVGAALYGVGRAEAARPVFERALALLDAEEPSDVRAEALHNYASVLAMVEGNDAAVPVAEEAIATFERTVGPDHPSLAASLTLLASLHRDAGRKELAPPLLERALQIRTAHGGSEVPVALISAQLGVYASDVGDHERGRSLLTSSYEQLVASVGPSDQRTLIVSVMLASVLRKLSRFVEAHTLLREAFDRLEGTDSRIGPENAAGLNMMLAWTELVLGDDEAALAHGRAAASICRECRPHGELGQMAWAVALWRSGGDPSTIVEPPFALSDLAKADLQPEELELVERMREASPRR